MSIEQAIKILESIYQGCEDVIKDQEAHKDAVDLARLVKQDCRKAIKEVLAQPEHEPVGEVSKAEFGDYPVICWRKGYVAKIGDKFYTTPPQRTWVGLTDEEIDDLFEANGNETTSFFWVAFARAIEAKLKEKNT